MTLMGTLFGLAKNKEHEYELVSQGEAKEKAAAVRKIFRSVTMKPNQPSQQSISGQTDHPGGSNQAQTGQASEGTSSNSKLRGKLDESLPRFGPVYEIRKNVSKGVDPGKRVVQEDEKDQSFMLQTKKSAWLHIKEKSKEKNHGVTKELYSAAVKRVANAAKDAYGDKISKIRMSKFRLMMIKDGCFFIQLAFLILGKSNLLGYKENDPIFSIKPEKKDIRRWMEAMFFVGNQVPLVVLKELMKQQFFHDIVANGNWEPRNQTGLCREVLYEMLVAPPVKQPPLDLLHCLHNMLLGPEPLDIKAVDQDGDDEVDLEANEEGIFIQGSMGDGENMTTSGERLKTFLRLVGLENAFEDSRRIFPCAVDLKQSGIHIKKLDKRGIRNIHYQSRYLWANLHLPVLPVDDDLEILFSNLMTYEMTKQFDKHDRRVSSYVRFMKDLVQTPQDVKLLRKRGIIKGSSENAEKLPRIFSRLCSEDIVLTPEFRRMKRKIGDYSSPWIHYRGILNLVAFLTLLQTFFALLAYFRHTN